jgi:haloalkane dehalogenase
MLTIRDKTFEGLYPFTPHYYTHQGLDIHYVDEGSGEPVVMVHGDPTWGFLYRNFIPPLSQHHRCIVPDQMGMGKSAVPQERSLYRLEQHCANLEALLLHLDLHDITLILHDWGGPVGLGFATRHPVCRNETYRSQIEIARDTPVLLFALHLYPLLDHRNK